MFWRKKVGIRPSHRLGRILDPEAVRQCPIDANEAAFCILEVNVIDIDDRSSTKSFTIMVGSASEVTGILLLEKRANLDTRLSLLLMALVGNTDEYLLLLIGVAATILEEEK